MARKFGYQAKKLYQARRALMLPHWGGEAGSILAALHACSLGFKDLDESTIDDANALEWINVIKSFMERDVSDTEGKGAFWVIGDKMTVEEKSELSNAIDGLATWFNEKDKLSD